MFWMALAGKAAMNKAGGGGKQDSGEERKQKLAQASIYSKAGPLPQQKNSFVDALAKSFDLQEFSRNPVYNVGDQSTKNPTRFRDTGKFAEALNKDYDWDKFKMQKTEDINNPSSPQTIQGSGYDVYGNPTDENDLDLYGQQSGNSLYA